MPFVLSATSLSAFPASRSAFAFAEISFITVFVASRSVIVTLDKSPISSLLFKSFSSTQTSRLPAETFSTTPILVLMLLVIDEDILIPNAAHISIITNTAVPIVIIR